MRVGTNLKITDDDLRIASRTRSRILILIFK